MKATFCCALTALMENWIHAVRPHDHLWWWKDRQFAIGVSASTTINRDDGSPLVTWLVKRLADGNEVSGSARDVVEAGQCALRELERWRAHDKRHAGWIERMRDDAQRPHLSAQFPHLLQPYVSPF